MNTKNYQLTLTANASTLDLMVKIFEDLVTHLVDVEDASYTEGIQLPQPVDLEGDEEFIRGVLSHEAVDEIDEPLSLGLEDLDGLEEFEMEPLAF